MKKFDDLSNNQKIISIIVSNVVFFIFLLLLLFLFANFLNIIPFDINEFHEQYSFGLASGFFCCTIFSMVSDFICSFIYDFKTILKILKQDKSGK